MKKTILILVYSILLMTFIACKENASDNTESIVGLLALTQIQQSGSSSRPCKDRIAIDQIGVYNAKEIVSAPANTNSGFQDSLCAADGVLGMGSFNGSLDVFTLDTNGAGASLILGWNGKKVTNATGADFIVFENPFQVSGNVNTVFLEPVIVEVGNDQTNWCGWNPTYTGGGTFSNNPTNWLRFAGLKYVDYNQITNPMNSTTLFASGGGDSFDLGDANFGNSGTGCSGALKTELQTNGFLYVKLTSAKAILTSLPIPSSNENPDIDGVIAKQVSP
ncbi:LIC_13355 family lipoprotein [Leptospira yasudae]|uniref:LIC_13355 family lipoprotein n=1 Tax=Leptospira yasudae TaxID=2202201 RepID=A0A6N4QC51_9LEPT|nr:LIC_13355 family lipoprotein [Leptospira yasudae]TGL73670.1 LIC_13355 family lipoprotein [Leptospira yasudae]TGL78809.1 LIC_13355 family lipoprotein [Leptospira yasudae]TGL83449.1 LIC_13355 family lipoprotein [Leptospira yasudae]